jgi:hypothetical protein
LVSVSREPVDRQAASRDEAEAGAIELGADARDETRNSGEIDRELLLRPEAEVVRQSRPPVLADRQICAIPTTEGG